MAGTPRLLTDEQIALVADYVRGGETVLEASKWVLETLGIRVAKSTIWNYPEVKRAIKDRQTAFKVDTNEKLEKAKPNIVENLLKCMRNNEKRQNDIAEAMADLPIKSQRREYLSLAEELRSLESRYVDYVKEFSKMYEASTLKESDVQESLSSSASEELRYLKSKMPKQVFPKLLVEESSEEDDKDAN